MSFEAMEAEQDSRSLCFSCNRLIDQSKSMTDMIMIDHVFGYSKKRLLFHSECFYEDAGNAYKAALYIPPASPHNTFGPPTTMESLHKNQSIAQMSMDGYKFALEEEKKRQRELEFQHIRKQYQKLIEAQVKSKMYELPESWKMEMEIPKEKK